MAITDECSLAGVVKAHVAAKEHDLHLIIGSEFNLTEGIRLVALAPSRAAYAELSGLISLGRRRSPKGEYELALRDVIFHLKRCLLIWLPTEDGEAMRGYGRQLARLCRERVWIGVHYLLGNDELRRYRDLQMLAGELRLPLVACGDVQMHCAARKPLHDVMTALRHNCSVAELGSRRLPNAQQHLRSLAQLERFYPAQLLEETQRIARQCRFSLDELRYEYPEEVVPEGYSARELPARAHLAGRRAALARRHAGGDPRAHRGASSPDRRAGLRVLLSHVYDVVRFARERGILCQGRGSAANSVVCYCLFITEVSPEKVSLLFERFISRERDEPPDIDVDFEHERREEVIQYIYRKYTPPPRRAGRHGHHLPRAQRRARRRQGPGPRPHLRRRPGQVPGLVGQAARPGGALCRARPGATQRAAASVSTAQLFYRWCRRSSAFRATCRSTSAASSSPAGPSPSSCPSRTPAWPDRTVIQWDKEDIEALGLLKVDVLALGMLSAIRKSLDLVRATTRASAACRTSRRKTAPPTTCCSRRTRSACSRSSRGRR
jgi:error-prone DNA polymerase